MNEVHAIGVISDTHGLLRAEALAALKGVELIVHAGDIGDPHILQQLEIIAPVVAVEGNTDMGEWANALPHRKVVRVGAVHLLVLHDLHEIELNPATPDIRVVISGHTHKPLVEERDGILYVNPGSAGPRRFKLPITVARLTIQGTAVSGQIIELPV